MQPWIIQWEADGWLGLFGSLWGSIKSGASAWWEGEGEFWNSVGEWLSNLPDMLGDAWDSLSESAKALWENRDQILALLQSLAEGSVAAFEAGLEAIARALQSIPGLEEIAQLLSDIVEESAEWAGAMIEMATQTRVLAVLGGTMLGTMMMIPPNFWSDMVGLGVGYLIPELFIAIVLAIIAFFTAGAGGADCDLHRKGDKSTVWCRSRWSGFVARVHPVEIHKWQDGRPHQGSERQDPRDRRRGDKRGHTDHALFLAPCAPDKR